MITKITSSNRENYANLFAKANTKLAEAGLTYTVTDLVSYFSYFKLLTGLDQTFNILPLDEPLFEIDADKRLISVPSEFSANGISVEGDHYSEILFFTIDRYYDNVDLFGDDIKCKIQWENVNKKSGISEPLFMDETTYAASNKIIFGWAIPPEVAEVSGTIRFAVRFYEEGTIIENGSPILLFSLNTQIASAKIIAGLNYEYDASKDGEHVTDYYNNAKAIISARAKNSGITTSSSVLPPVYALNLVDGEVELGANGKLKLYAIAQPDPTDANSTIVDYVWDDNSDGTTDFILASEVSSTVLSGVTYYQAIKDINTEAITGYEAITSGTPDPTTSYIKCNYRADVTAPGSYYVNASVINSAGESEATKSNVTVVPGVKTTITGTIGDNYPVDETGKLTIGNGTGIIINAGDGDTITYSWTKDATAMTDTTDTVTATDGVYALTITAKRNGEVKTFDSPYTYNVEGLAIAPVIVLLEGSEKHTEDYTHFITRGTVHTIKADLTNSDALKGTISYVWQEATELDADGNLSWADTTDSADIEVPDGSDAILTHKVSTDAKLQTIYTRCIVTNKVSETNFKTTTSCVCTATVAAQVS